MVANWSLEGRIIEKFKNLFSNKIALSLISIYLLHLLGLIYTEDFGYALNDLRIKLPLLGLPIVISTSDPLPTKQFIRLLWVFICACFITSIISCMIYSGLLQDNSIDNPHEISPFISHIRLSLSIVLAYLVLIWLFVKETKYIYLRFVYLSLATWFVLFIFILESMTGIVIFFLVSFLLFCRYIFFYQTRLFVKIISGIAFIISISAITYYIIDIKNSFMDIKDDLQHLEKYTLNGNPYRHNLRNKQIENGHYVWIYISEEELRKEWNKRSALGYKGKDKKGQPLYSTIARYLTSKGLRKDSLTLSSLTDNEIRNIENGIANADFLQLNPLKKRIVQIIEEFHNYSLDHNPGGNSVTQRIEFWKTALHIIKNNLLIGVGTGDVQQAFEQQYVKDQSQLSTEFRLRAHNQYLTMAVSFGIPGLVWFLFVLFYPLVRRENHNYLYISWSLIAAISMINEDTLETQAGVTFFAFFASIFMFALKQNDNTNCD